MATIFDAIAGEVGELRTDPSTRIVYRCTGGTTWIVNGTGTPSSAGFPTSGNTVGEVRKDKATGGEFFWSGSAWVTADTGTVSGATIIDGTLNGSKLVNGTVSTTKLSDDTTVPTIVSATRTNNTTLVVLLSEFLDIASITKSNAGGFLVKETGTPGTTYAVSAVAPGVDNKHVVLTVANMLVSGKEGVTVTYATGGNGTVQDRMGNLLATDATGVAVTAWDTTVPTMTSATKTNVTTLVVLLSELADQSSITKGNAGGFTVCETGAPSTLYVVSGIAPGTDNQHVVLTVADITASAAAGVTIKYTAGGNGTVGDIAGNVLATNATGVNIAAWA